VLLLLGCWLLLLPSGSHCAARVNPGPLSLRRILTPKAERARSGPYSLLLNFPPSVNPASITIASCSPPQSRISSSAAQQIVLPPLLSLPPSAVRPAWHGRSAAPAPSLLKRESDIGVPYELAPHEHHRTEVMPTSPVQDRHRGLLPKKCRYCERRFSKAEHLKRHQRSRTLSLREPFPD